MTQKYYHGALLSPKDERDYQFNDLVAKSSFNNLPTEYINPLAQEIQVVDQGASETCVACSLSYLRWFTEKKQSNNTKQFSPNYIYANRAEDHYKGEGMILREALQTVRKQGVCYYEDLPGFYDIQTAIQQYQNKKQELDPKAHPFRVSSFYSINQFTELKKAIYTLGGVIISTPIFYCLYSPNEKGEIEYNGDEKQPYDGYHAMTLIGWTSTHWIVLNSWGTQWGKNGIAYIPFDYPIVEAWGIVDQVTEVMFKMSKFKDIENHWAKESIDKAADKGAVTGFEDGLFHPDEPITRAQLCAILDRLKLFD